MILDAIDRGYVSGDEDDLLIFHGEHAEPSSSEAYEEEEYLGSLTVV